MAMQKAISVYKKGRRSLGVSVSDRYQRLEDL